MELADVRRRLIVNADDFGSSSAINEAVEQAHSEGILTTASLMVNGGAVDEALRIARRNPRLGVGLHLSLVCAGASLSPAEIPGLVNERGAFAANPALAGMRYFFDFRLRPQLEREIEAQFAKFHAAGLTLDHLNGHLNLHLHPVIFGLLVQNRDRWGIRTMRLTRDPFWLNARIAEGRWLYRASHAVIFNLLSSAALPRLRAAGIRHTKAVFGLLQNAEVTEEYVARLLPCLPQGDSELYSHPSAQDFKHERDALLSLRLRRQVEEQKIQLIRYQDL